MNVSLSEERGLKLFTDTGDVSDPATMRELYRQAGARDSRHRENILSSSKNGAFVNAVGERYIYLMLQLRHAAQEGQRVCIVPSVTKPGYDPVTRGKISRYRERHVNAGLTSLLRGRQECVDLVAADLIVSHFPGSVNVALFHCDNDAPGTFSWWIMLELVMNPNPTP